MTNPLVSIISLTYNHERFVAECIESALAQNYDHWEMLIVDDGSLDRTAEIVRGFTDQRIRFRTQEHRGIHGLAQTYNEALAQARGELIGILEGDDFWPSDKLATLVPEFEDPAVVLAFGRTTVTTATGQPAGMTIPEPTFEAEFGDGALFNSPVGAATRAMFYWPAYNYTFPCSVLVRRSALEAIGGFQHVPGLPFVDYQTFLTLSLHGRFSYTSKVMGYWRRHGQSATAWRRPDLTETTLLRFMEEFMRQHREEIPLSAEDEAAIKVILSGWRHRIAIYQGRAALSERHWTDARDRFRLAMKARRPIIRAKGAVGLVASLLHINLEWLVEIRARLFAREARWTGVYRMPTGTTPDNDPAAPPPSGGR